MQKDTLLIERGWVVFPAKTRQCNLLVKNGKLAQILPPTETRDGCRRFDAEGLVIFPGGVDGHVHLDYAMGDIQAVDSFATGTRAALAGGTTTIVDFVEPRSGESSAQAIERRLTQAEQSLCDYALHFIFTSDYRRQIEELERIAEYGIAAFKLYTTYDNLALSYEDIDWLLGCVGERGCVLVHAEDSGRIRALCQKYEEQAGRGVIGLYETRDNEVEAYSVKRLAQLQEKWGTQMCIAHTSTAQVVALRKSFFPRLKLETCPHYLQFTKERMEGADGALYAVNPPIKSEVDAQALWAAALDGTLDMISTDHCPFTKAQKLAGTSYKNVPCGLAGIQTRLPYLFSEGVARRGMSYQRFAEITAANAAKFYGLYPRKGVIQEGSDADFVFIHPTETWQLTKAELVDSIGYNLFEGTQFTGRIKAVFLRGEQVTDGTGTVTATESGIYQTIKQKRG